MFLGSDSRIQVMQFNSLWASDTIWCHITVIIISYYQIFVNANAGIREDIKCE